MRSLRHEIFVPTALLAAVIVAALAFLGWDSARQARRAEVEADHVRAATALALAATDAAHDEERWTATLATRPDPALVGRIEEARERASRLSAEIEALPHTPRADDVWRRFVEARGAVRAVADEVLAAAARGDPDAAARALDQWHLVNDRADRLLRDFTGYHLNRLDRTVAALQARRARALGAAATALAVGLLLAIALAALLARTVVRPIVAMAAAAKRVQATGAPIPVAGADRADELGVLARAFNDMTERLTSANATLAGANASLEEAVRARDEFISVASHELKTPITPLALRVQQLVKAVAAMGDGEGGASREQREKVAAAARSLNGHVAKLRKLVDNLLDISRIDSGQLALQPEEFPVGAAVRDALDRVAEELAEARCEVRLEGPLDASVRGDRLRLEQVLVNLLGNAAKYAPGGPVAVRVVAAERAVTVEVEDRGKGIGPEDAQRIFHRFERAVEDRHVSGLGLGLYIAREIAHAHGGDLTVRTSPGAGTTFALTIPRDGAPRVDAQSIEYGSMSNRT